MLLIIVRRKQSYFHIALWLTTGGHLLTDIIVSVMQLKGSRLVLLADVLLLLLRSLLKESIVEVDDMTL